jgi:sensory rhodopsin
MEYIFTASAIIFALSSFGFYLAKKKTSNLPFLVSAITLVSSLVMLEGSFITMSATGQELYWTRWVFYMVSCTLLMYSISKYLKLESKRVEIIYLTAFVMLTGAFASALSGLYMFLHFFVGGVFYCLLVKHIFASKKKKELDTVKPFILLGWTGFPIIFLLAPEGLGYISNAIAALAYLVLDIYTKIYFYVRIQKK